MLNNLTDRKRPTHHQCRVPSNSIATELTRNGMHKTPDRAFSKQVQREISHFWKTDTPGYTPISGSFSQEEFNIALQHLKCGKATNPDAICPELITHAGMEIKPWLREFLSSCLRRHTIPKVRRKALVVSILKPNKLPEDLKSYLPISLLCIPYKMA